MSKTEGFPLRRSEYSESSRGRFYKASTCRHLGPEYVIDQRQVPTLQHWSLRLTLLQQSASSVVVIIGREEGV